MEIKCVRSFVRSYGNTSFHSLSAPASVSVCDPLAVSVGITHAGKKADVVVTVFMEWLNASVRQCPLNALCEDNRFMVEDRS